MSPTFEKSQIVIAVFFFTKELSLVTFLLDHYIQPFMGVTVMFVDGLLTTLMSWLTLSATRRESQMFIICNLNRNYIIKCCLIEGWMGCQV